MSIPQQYFVNYKTRMRQILGGRGIDHEANVKQALKDGYVEVTADEQDAFGLDTQKLLDAGWGRSPRNLAKYLHVLEKTS